MPNSQPTYEQLYERTKALERQLQSIQGNQIQKASTITPIHRPKGEAGSRKRGFNIFQAMELAKFENGDAEYDRMRHSVRKSCIRVGLNCTSKYKDLDHAKLGQVIRLVRDKFPYLTEERFPHNWAITDMVKTYVAGVRKSHNKELRAASKNRNSGEVQDDGDGEDGDGGDGDGEDGNDDDSNGEDGNDEDNDDNNDIYCSDPPPPPRRLLPSTKAAKPKRTRQAADSDTEEAVDHSHKKQQVNTQRSSRSSTAKSAQAPKRPPMKPPMAKSNPTPRRLGLSPLSRNVTNVIP